MGKTPDVPHLRFGLLHLFAAVTSCAIAFAVLKYGTLPSLLVLAGAVPFLWFGAIIFSAGDALTTLRSSVLYGVGAVLMSAGFFVAIWSIFIGSIGLVLTMLQLGFMILGI